MVRLNYPTYGVVVGYRTTPWDRYQIIETDSIGRHPRGAARWISSKDITPIGKISRVPGRIMRKNDREGTPEERGCACHCCVHMKGYEPEPDE